MTLYVFFLVLSAAVLHACWNLLSKKAQGKTPFIWLMYVASNIVYLPLLIYTVKQGDAVFSQPLLWFSLSSAVLHLGYYIVLQKGYRIADLSVVYPLARGSGPLFSSTAAILFLNEPLRISTSVGLLLIVAGVLVITGLRFKKEDNKGINNGIIYGVLTGLFIAIYTVNDTIAVKSYTISPLLLTLSTNFFSSVLLFPFVITKKEELKRELKTNKWLILAIAILSPAAYMLVLEALKYAPLTVVAPARETSIVLGVFIGSKAFNEEDSNKRIRASVLILGGIIALSLK